MYNSFGSIFRFTTWGESHGKAIGCVVDGVPSLINITQEEVQQCLDQRKPGQNIYSTSRKEADKVEILSGVFEGKTTGAPISMIIYNQDHRPQDYEPLKKTFRPGHADFAYFQKYGIRDYKGGGRSSARETACRVAASAIARKIIPEVDVSYAISQIGNIKFADEQIDFSFAKTNELLAPNPEAFLQYQKQLDSVKAAGDSIGSAVRVKISGVKPGLGEPIYNKINSKLAEAFFTINGVKAVEFGKGFDSCSMLGSEYNDQIYTDADKNLHYATNNSGGISGGISTGQDILITVAIRPASSISVAQNTIDASGNNIEIKTSGRFDCLISLRAAPVIAAMAYCVITDLTMSSRTNAQ